MKAGTETRQEACPVCRDPGAACTHGLLNGDGYPIHEWDCPMCGTSTAIVLDDCPVCQSFAREVAIHGTAKIEAALPGPYAEGRVYTEVVQADAERRWLIACNGFAVVVQPFHRDCVLHETGVVEVGDIEAAREAHPDGETFHMEVKPMDDYPDIDRIVRKRVLERRYKPVAVLDANMLYRVARALQHGTHDQNFVVICAEQHGQEKPEGDDPGGAALLVIPTSTILVGRAGRGRS